jgi:hypothetical protein
MVANGTSPSLIVTGQGGLGKTHTVLETIKEMGLKESEYAVFKGFSTARALYNTLYDNNDKVLIFDDYDSVLENKVSINILKSALDSYDKREITWNSMRKNDKYPSKFEFTGRIIFISNKDKKDIDQALLTRSLVVDLSMTKEEKINRMVSIIRDILPNSPLEDKYEALSFLDNNDNVVELSLRSLIKVTKIKNSFPDNWKDLASFMVNS